MPIFNHFKVWVILSPILGLSLIFTPQALALTTLYQLPMNLAAEAAMEAVESCRQNGYAVTATVVNREGLVQVVIRGDGATPHTIENSFYKAFTLITLGPITKQESTEAIARQMTPAALPVGSVPLAPNPITGISFSTGGVAIKVGDQLVAGIGVSGAPVGQLDQACALQGLEKINSRLVP